MNRKVITAIICIALLAGCDDVQPGEEKATIVAYDSKYHICGGAWVIQGKQKELRTLELPAEYRQKNMPVWIRYVPDTLRSAPSFANCNFVKLTSIRRR